MRRSIRAAALTAPADPWSDPAGTRLVGDPIDVVTGRVTERTLCFRLIGPLFLEWYRQYDSGHNALTRGFGFGHAHSYDHRLIFDADGLRLEEPVRRHTGFPALHKNGDTHTARGATLRRLSLLSYRLTRPGSPAIEFAFDHSERPARIARVLRGNAAIQFHYARNGHLVGLTHSTGLWITAKEDSAGRLVSLAGAWDGGAAERPILACEYDAVGNLVGVTDALGRSGSFGYDTSNRLVRRTDRRGYSFFFEYDAEGRCVRSAGEDGVMGVVLRYRTEERITEVTRSDGGKWTYHYDDGGWVTQVIGPYGDVRRFVKGEDGRTVGEVDGLGHQLDYVFDPAGSLIGKRFASARVIPMEAGEETAGPPPHRVADRPPEYLYGDLASRLLVAEQGLSAAPSDLRRMLPPEPEAPPPSPVVPPFGSLPWYPEPEGGREFTSFGHLVRQTLPGGGQRRWTYDANDGMHVFTDADGAATRLEYRSWNQLAGWIDSRGAETRYRFTTEDQISAVTDPGGTVTEFVYDKERRLCGVRRAGQLRESYRHDGVGNLIEKRDGAGTTLLTLTPTEDRLVAERRLASGGVHAFSYNAAGRFVSAKVDFSEVCFAYDALGRRMLDAREGLGVAHNFTAGPGLETTTVLNRFVVTREVQDARLTIRLPDGTWVRIERLGERVLQRTCSNGTTELCQFDEMGRWLASVIAFPLDGGRRWTRRWRYSAEGDLLEAEDSWHGTTRYRWDAAHRLVAATRPGGDAEEYVHDPAGNLLAQPGLSGVTLGRGNRLAAANGERFTYDLRHHIRERHASGVTVVYRYDSRDMLISVERPDGVWQAEYDALDRRVRAWQGEAEQRFFWDTDRLAAEVFPSGMLRIYVYADTLALTPVAFIDYPDMEADPAEGAVRFVFADQRGAPVLVEDAQGTVLWGAQLLAFGAATIAAPNGLVLNLRFPGHYFDAATGLHYNRFRYYDPILGRYIQSDPIGIGGCINVYAYPANPLLRVDVRGLSGAGSSPCREQQGTTQTEPKPEKEDNKGPLNPTIDHDTDPRARMGELADQHQNLPADERPNTVARLETQAGAVSTGVSGSDTEPHPVVQNALNNVPEARQSDYHGECAEIHAMSNAARAADGNNQDPAAALAGSSLQTAQVRGPDGDQTRHGQPQTPCSSCQNVMNQLGVAYNPR
jgi:RHS repeat-associated protein